MSIDPIALASALINCPSVTPARGQVFDVLEAALEPLGFTVARQSGPDRAWIVTVPTFRVDVTREVDVIEEVGRHYGFDRLPIRFPALVAAQAAPDPAVARDRKSVV